MSFFLLLLGFSTVFSYKLWVQQPVEDQFGEVIALNNSTSIIQSISSPQGKTLVPKGAILGANNVDTLYYNYIVEIEENHDLSVFIDKVFFEKDNFEYQDEDNLLIFDYVIERISETKISLTVLVSLNMPETEAQYNLICNNSISFHLQLR
jgi:hypothetical protein